MVWILEYALATIDKIVNWAHQGAKTAFVEDGIRVFIQLTGSPWPVTFGGFGFHARRNGDCGEN